MCFSKSLDHPPLFDNLHRPRQVNDTNSNLCNDKCDYLEVEDIKNLNPYEKSLDHVIKYLQCSEQENRVNWYTKYMNETKK